MTAVFPICNPRQSNAGKFKKWKVELVWYEGKRENKARIYFEDAEYAERMFEVLQERQYKIGKFCLMYAYEKKPFIELLRIFGRISINRLLQG